MKTSADKEQNGRDQTVLMSDFTEIALKNYEQALRAGFKMQEEAGRWWSATLSQAALNQDWQKRFTTMTGMANQLMPLAQQRIGEVMELMEENSRKSAKLLKKAVDAAQTAAVAESQTKWIDFWAFSMGAMRSNTEAVSQMSSKAISSWIDFVRKSGDLAEAQPSKSV